MWELFKMINDSKQKVRKLPQASFRHEMCY